MEKLSVSRMLIKEDWKKILKGAGIAIGAAAVAFFLENVSNIDFGQYTYLIIPILSILLNALRKYFASTQY